MKILSRLTGLALMGASLAFFTPPASANGVAATQETASADADINVSAVESYFNGISTLKAAFTQAAPDGTLLTGQFYLNRPGRLRFEYDEPLNDFIVADGERIYFYDGQMEQVSQTDIGNTLADFLLRPQLSLQGELQVIESVRRAGLMWVTIVERANPDKGRLTLGFTEAPLQLKKWRVTDGEDRITEVELDGIERDIKLPNTLFRFSDPRRDIDWDYN